MLIRYSSEKNIQSVTQLQISARSFEHVLLPSGASLRAVGHR
jgi:hypothetical protein